ncbi:MAG: TIGR00296 family protein [Halobacteriales archaeon]|nr:TIGR00296 family protein [Halobacteriales archaeon]
MLSIEDGKDAVRLARRHAEDAAGLARPKAHPAPQGVLAERRGAFVTLWSGLALRGCVGVPEPTMRLADALREGAEGAVRDPRFPPVTRREMDALRVEVSVLTPPLALVCDPEELPQRILVGTHGLVVRHARAAGLLLPQVPVEHGMTAEEFLGATCRKAGLGADAWRARDGLRWSTFEAEVFEEAEPRGPVHRRGEERPEVA